MAKKSKFSIADILDIKEESQCHDEGKSIKQCTQFFI